MPHTTLSHTYHPHSLILNGHADNRYECMCTHTHVHIMCTHHVYTSCVHTLGRYFCMCIHTHICTCMCTLFLHVYMLSMCTYCLSLSCRRKKGAVIVVCQSPLGGNTLSAHAMWLCVKRSVYNMWVCVSHLSLVVVVLRDDDVGWSWRWWRWLTRRGCVCHVHVRLQSTRTYIKCHNVDLRWEWYHHHH
jgi:hypothetical protein